MGNVNIEELREKDIRSICVNSKLGESLSFIDAVKPLERVRDGLITLSDLGYSEEFPDDLKAETDERIEQLKLIIKRIVVFDPNSPDNHNERDSILKDVKVLYKNFFNVLQPQILGLQGLKLQDIVVERDKLEKESINIDELRSQVSDEGVALQTSNLGLAFGLSEKRHRKISYIWLIVTIALMILLGGFLWEIYLVSMVTVAEDFTGLFKLFIPKLFLVSVISYAISFCSRNFRVSSNLTESNAHRKNIATTMELAADSETISEVFKETIYREGAGALVKHLPIGYLGSKQEAADKGPTHELITGILGAAPKRE